MPKCANPYCDKFCEEFTYEGTDIISYTIYCRYWCDYNLITHRCNIYKEDLMSNRFHPQIFSKFGDGGFIEDGDF